MAEQLYQKKILITGCAGGMGLAVSNLLAANGYEVFGLDYKEPTSEFHGHFVKCDLTQEESVEEACQKISAADGLKRLDAILHLAGKYDLNSLVEMPEQDFRSIFEINVFAIYRVNKTFLPLMKKGGRIIITSSELAPLDPLPFTGIYGITKATIAKYVYSLRMELQLLGISVVEVRPGAVKTPLLDVSQNRLQNFVDNTSLYQVSGANFKKIVDAVEARNIEPEKLGELMLKILTARKPRFVYKINRNPLLILLNLVPDRLQTWIIKKILQI